jgi:nucleoid-associated protein YgaU
MRSGNGRHRRPRQAPAIVVTAGVTGAGIALPLLGAAGAHAADAETWDRVAQCESGGLWSADTGNGYYGGLQFALQTWNEYGGRDYAPRPDLASRSEQIVIAEKVLDAEGANKAWPSCALKTGLALDVIPDVDPDGTQSREPQPETGSTGAAAPDQSAPSDTAPSGGADHGAEAGDADRTEPGGAPTGDSPTQVEPGTGKHRGEPAPEEHTGEGHETGRPASRDGGSGRTQPSDGRYVVRPGDNLSEIAHAQALTGGWAALYASNEDLIGSDPDLILPGQRLVLDGSQQ